MKKMILYFFLLFYSKGFTQNHSPKRLSTAAVLELSKEYQNRALWFQNTPQYNQDSSIYYFEKASKLLKANPPIQYEQLADIYLQRSNFFANNYTAADLDSIGTIGWSYVQKATAKKRNNLLEYNYLTNWASVKLELGDHKKSLKLFSKALTHVEDFKNPDLQAKILLDKGIYYQRYGLEDEQKLALNYLSKSHAYYQKFGKIKNPLEFFDIYKTYINYYTEINTDSVYYYASQMQSVLKYIKRPSIHAWYYARFGRELITSPVPGETKISKKQYDEGKKNIVKALKILEFYTIKTSNIIPYGYGLLADLNLREKQYDQAISNYKKSEEGYLFLKNRHGAEDMSQYIGEAYRQKGDLANALKYYKKYFEQTLVFQKEKNERGLRENELQINLLTQDKKLIQKQNQQIIFSIVLFIVLILLALSYRNYRLKQKSNNLLAVFNTDLESKNTLLDKRNAEIELLMKEIHHRVKNNLEIVSSLLALQSAQIDDPNTKEAMAESQNRVNSIGIVHQKLYQGTNLGAVEMKDYFLNLSESILESFGAEGRVDLKLAMENLDLDIDTAVPLGLIVNELLTNCIKYAFPKGENGTITIKLQRQKDNILHLEVADNGIGKSSIIQGTGFGGQLISLLTHQLNGTMTEEIQNGTTIIFDFKLKKSA